MEIGSIRFAVLLILAALIATPLLAASYYPVRLDDPPAVYPTPDKFPVHGDGIADPSYDVQVRYNELASLSISGKKPEPRKLAPAPVLAEGAKLKKLCGGFFTISGAAVAAQGRLYFVDTHWQRIYRWTPETRDLKILRDNSLQPTQLAMDRAGNLIVISYAGKGTVYTFRPDALDDRITFIQPVATAPRPGMTAVLSVDYWGSHDFVNLITAPRQYQFISPDGTIFIPAGKDFIDGATNWGVKMADVLRAFSLAKAVPGRPFYVSEESEQKTYSGNIGHDGTLSNLKLFTEQGGESVIQDSKGNVYLAAGNSFIYDPSGKQMGTIDVLERPIDLVFGGKDGKTLFILTHRSLYSIQTLF